jgi:beta-galactosidase
LELTWIVPADKILVQHQNNTLNVNVNVLHLIFSGVNFDYTFNKADGQFYSMK